MKKARKLFGVALAIALVFNVFAIAAVAETNDVAHLDVNLQVGTYDVGTEVFTPLALGATISQDDVLTVRVTPESNFCVGAQNYLIMFDKNKFEVQGAGGDAFTVNADNAYFDQASSGYSGATNIPDINWPATFTAGERYDVYQAIQINFQADSNSNSGGYARALPGTWLFQFDLKATEDFVEGTDARIFLDDRWFRNPSSTNLKGYITKYDDCDEIIAYQGNPNYDYTRDFTGADITLPTEGVITTSTITFVTGGGTVIGPLTGDVGSPVVAPANPTRTNYVFKAWDTAIPAVFPADDVTVTAQWVMKGDTNGNGAITAADATLVLRHVAELTALSGDAMLAADSNGNGTITAADATVISRYVAEIITQFPD
ncbi:MAG: hypothetical protein GXZ02_01100 [Clostridiales bacterium]|nr:hypothetical protein [Clostridiales bacterium]